MIPQLIYLTLALIGLMIASYQHGKPKEGDHDVTVTIVSTLLLAILLYFGGFFNPLFN